MPKKYEGLDGTELAISESQERMAIVIDPADLAGISNRRCRGEPRNGGRGAAITDTRRLRMRWRGKTIVDLSRDFIDTNGVQQESA